MKNESWRGAAGANREKRRDTPTPYGVQIFLGIVGFSIMLLVTYLLHTQPDASRRPFRKMKRGEAARQHKEYMQQQAMNTHKSYLFPKYDFEPDFAAVKSLRATCPDHCAAEVCGNVLRSTLHSACCKTNVTAQTWIFPLLITATPRSGTVATLNLFRILGLQLGDDWEEPRRDGRISWIHGFNEYDHVQQPGNQMPMAYYGSPHKALIGDRYRVVIHLVRDPLSSITSIACTEPLADIQWSEYVRTHISMEKWGGLKGRKDFLIAMKMWLEWHGFLDSICAPRVHLEDLFDPQKAVGVISDIFALINRKVPAPEEILQAIEAVKAEKKQNKRDHRPRVTWPELFRADPELARRIHERSCQYGYHCEDNVQGFGSEASLQGVEFPVCQFEEDTERGWSPGRVSAMLPELRPLRRRL